MRRRSTIFSALVLLALAVPHASIARTWHLLPGGGGDVATIAKAMLVASPGDTVLLGCGTYYEHDISLTSGVCLRSETGAWDCATIDAQSQGRVLYANNVAAGTSIEGITIKSGGYHVNGGGLFSSGTIRVAGCRFTDNGATTDGGGIFFGGTATVEDCQFDGNWTSAGGDPGGMGGGIYAQGALTLRRSSFLSNSAADGGGGVWAAWADASDCVFDHNIGWTGNGIGGSQITLTRCTISRNLGGGFESDYGGALTNCLIAFNEAAVTSSGSYTVDCCDVYGNSDGDWVGPLAGHLGVDGNISADPLFCDPLAGDVHLLDTSPCAAAQQPGCGRMGALDVECVACPSRTWALRADGTGDAPNLQAALDAACFRDTILLADATYQGTGNRDVDFRGKPVVLRSASGDPEACVIDCQGSSADPHRAFLIGPGNFGSPRIQGITITNGWVTGVSGAGDGGAIFFTTGDLSDGQFPELVKCRITHCYAGEFGGAIYSRYRSPILRDCRIVANAAGQDGGGVAFAYGTPVVERCAVTADSAGRSGGGVIFSQSTPAGFSGNVIAGNIATRGGGISTQATEGVWTSDTVAGNSAPTGAGIYFYYYTSPVLESCLVAGNTGGAGVACALYSAPSLRCSDVSGNAGGDWVDCIASQGSANGNFSADPLFCDAASYDFGLLAASPCLPGQHPGGGSCGLIGALPQGCGALESGVVSGEGAPGGEVLRFGLGPCVPNPFNPAIAISGAAINYTIPGGARAGEGGATGHVSLRIYDATGRLVRTLMEKDVLAGRYAARWDGRDSSGRGVASGVYFSVLSWGDKRATDRLVLLK